MEVQSKSFNDGYVPLNWIQFQRKRNRFKAKSMTSLCFIFVSTKKFPLQFAHPMKHQTRTSETKINAPCSAAHPIGGLDNLIEAFTVIALQDAVHPTPLFELLGIALEEIPITKEVLRVLWVEGRCFFLRREEISQSNALPKTVSVSRKFLKHFINLQISTCQRKSIRKTFFMFANVQCLSIFLVVFSHLE